MHLEAPDINLDLTNVEFYTVYVNAKIFSFAW